jgi:hypothetical protein
MFEFIKRPDIVEFPIQLEDGTMRNFVGYRVLHTASQSRRA